MDVFNASKLRRFVFPLACLAAVAMLFISEGSYRQSVDTLDELGATGAARTVIRELDLSVLDAEIGQRGYLLTNRKEYLQPYADALRRIDQSLRALALYYAENPAPTEDVRRLHTLIETRLSELALTIHLHNRNLSMTLRHQNALI